MALGATPGRIVRMTLASAARWAAWGVILGAGASRAAASVLQSLLFRLGPGDPAAMAAAIAILPGIALAAAAAPARRAAQLDPMETLREG
jgi:ABC-type antimicrobial peptide transport system permease subunit